MTTESVIELKFRFVSRSPTPKGESEDGEEERRTTLSSELLITINMPFCPKAAITERKR